MSSRSLEGAHPASVVRDRGGRIVELKVHRATWSGRFPQNSLDGLRECYAERVARAEIDFRHGGDELIVAHDARELEGALLLRDAIDVVRAAPPGPTVLMLDAKDEAPWSPVEVERIARLIGPVQDRVFVGSPADWNLRRLRAALPDLAITFDPMYYLEAKDSRSPLPGATGAYGYHDAHPLAFRSTVPVAEYVRERLIGLCHLVPGMRELHVRLTLFEQMRADGVDVTGIVHGEGVLVDVWTLDAGTPRWRERLDAALEGGVDIVTTNTPRALSEAAASFAVRA